MVLSRKFAHPTSLAPDVTVCAKSPQSSGSPLMIGRFRVAPVLFSLRIRPAAATAGASYWWIQVSGANKEYRDGSNELQEKVEERRGMMHESSPGPATANPDPS